MGNKIMLVTAAALIAAVAGCKKEKELTVQEFSSVPTFTDFNNRPYVRGKLIVVDRTSNKFSQEAMSLLPPEMGCSGVPGRSRKAYAKLKASLRSFIV